MIVLFKGLLAECTPICDLHSMVHQLPLSQACEGFTFYKKATGKGPYTTLDHQTALKKLRT